MKYYSPEGNIEVWDTKPEGYYTPEEWESLHPPAPMPEPTVEEKLAQLTAQYEADKKELSAYYTDAMIHGDTDLMSEIADEMTTLDNKYAEDYEAIKGDE